MDRRNLAIWIVLLGTAIGLLGTLFFYQKLIGLSFPLFIAAGALTLLATARAARSPVRMRNLWPVIPMLGFAVMRAVRADPLIGLLNGLATFALGGLALAYMPLGRNLDEASLGEQMGALLMASVYPLFAPFIELTGAARWLSERRWQGRGALPVLRGLVIALPVLVVFTALLGAADAVFAGVVDDVLKAFNILALPFESLVEPLFFIAVIGWLAMGTLSFGVARHHVTEERIREEWAGHDADTDPDEADPNAAEKPKRDGLFRLGMIEAGIVLGLVVLLFAAFVAIQFRYFFGGETIIAERGLTFAEYARRGFFELVMVSVLTLGLGLWLDGSTTRATPREARLFQGLNIALVLLIGVMLVSASGRMLLYEEAFGFTQLRVYTHIFMFWLGVLFVFFLLSVFRVRPQIFALGVTLVTIGYLATLNGLNVDLYIAERNIARHDVGQELDVSFLAILSADAAPAIIPAYRAAEPGTPAHDWTGQWLAHRLHELDALRAGAGSSFLSANSGRDSAWALLDALRDQLPAYDPSYFRSGLRYID